MLVGLTIIPLRIVTLLAAILTLELGARARYAGRDRT